MFYFKLFLYSFCLSTSALFLLGEIQINPVPCAIGYTPNSVLDDPPPEKYLRFAGDRPRYSTCGGVCWFQENQNIFAVGMQSSSIQIYRFSDGSEQLTPLKTFTNSDGIDLNRPENISISKNEKWIAIPNMASGKVQLYQTHVNNFLSLPPIATIQDSKVHGVQFSSDNQFLTYVTFASKYSNSKICTYRIKPKKNGKIDFQLTQAIPNPFQGLKPKSIAFSKDNRYVVIGFCIELSGKEGGAQGLIASYAFDHTTGTISDSPITVIDDIFSAETVAFSHDYTSVYAVDQVKDRVTGHEFNPSTGALGKSWIALKNPESQLSLPHGIAFSSNGKYVAVSNYGDDKVTVYQIEQ